MDAAGLIARGALNRDRKNTGHQDAEVLGVIVDVVELYDSSEPDGIEDFELWEDNEETVKVFLFLSTQWTFAVRPTGEMVRVGMAYTAIPFAFKALGIKKKRREEVTLGLRIMESATLLETRKAADAAS